jgi:hypothetical protein
MGKRIGIVQVDGKEYMGQIFPNLALMKVCAYHEMMGDEVEWYNGNLFSEQYDQIYASKIFSFSPMPDLPKEKTMMGGTGIDFFNRLPPEIESMPISYSLYPDCNFHVGFSMKGCRFACKFCCVPKKEGRPYNYNTIDEILTNPKGGHKLMLLDNDFFGGSNWAENLKRIGELNLKVCFSQGLNIRILTPEQAELLAQVKYYNIKFNQRYLSFAWDKYKDGKLIMKGIEICNKAGIPTTHMQFFVLIGFDTTHEQNMERVMTLKNLGAMPFVMPYNKDDEYQKAFTRWVNHRATFKSCTWEEYIYNPNNKKKNQLANEYLMVNSEPKVHVCDARDAS